ncbi:MAG: prolipoprotein diacylglyceryl transferase, partial [Magnetococcales bacterium]|nr:prolipoprotein diacylglyceryl transferase [Magnetococcales bacterium]
PQPRGRLLGMFLLGYALCRFLVEFVREPDAHLGYLTLGLTMGQWLTWPMVIAALFLLRPERRSLS